MHTSKSLLDIHERSHRNVRGLVEHCRQLTAEELGRDMEGFGYPSIRLQIHHAIGAEKYWVSVLEGHMDADEDEADYQTVDMLERFRQKVFNLTERYLRGVSVEELNTQKLMTTWGNRQRLLVPAQVILRTQVHYYHHQGQVLAMCRLLGKPGSGLDYPIE
jgi:uncharacterized damage-inducible protein DinB